MSVQFGRWSQDCRPADSRYLLKVKAALAPYGPDGCSCYSKDCITILYHAFHTTKESRREAQPHVSPSGAVITWDGRLDNRQELLRNLGNPLSIGATDVEIVAGAYEQWGSDSFAKLRGDWALSIWDAKTGSLVLAKDPIGTRHMYYTFDKDEVVWSSILDPLVLVAGKALTLCEEYIAGWLSFLPAAHLTPYAGIQSVPPSSLVCIQAGNAAVREYWDFDPAKYIRYRNDTEYEEHFRVVFAEAVRRRLRADGPVLAELSGGMDSSSIVCMADTLIARGISESHTLHTLSYYNDSEPNWNERPYFTRVEEKRGRPGCHIDVGKQGSFVAKLGSDRFTATPTSGGSRMSEASRQFIDCMLSQGNRILLSGIGGDEVAGGTPTPTIELEDLLARAQLPNLAHKLKLWALNKRKPWFHLLFETTLGFLPSAIVRAFRPAQTVPWLASPFLKRNRQALEGYRRRIRLLGPLPSFQQNMSALAALRRQLGCTALPIEPPYEKRYPFLDRDFLEFLFAIPREQLVRPNERRSLMRRALAGIVPDEILKRRRKAFVTRRPLAALLNGGEQWIEKSHEMLCSSLGCIDPDRFREVFKSARQDQEIPIVTISRTLILECWLQHLAKCAPFGDVRFERNTPSLLRLPRNCDFPSAEET
jgi:asparagine synthase (glutamine-hydrolysing)